MAVQALDIANDLSAKGMERQQAEAVGSAIVRSLDDTGSSYATKADIIRVEGQIDRARADMLLALEKQRTQLILSIGAIVALVNVAERVLLG